MVGVVGVFNFFIQNQCFDGFKKVVVVSGEKVKFFDMVDGKNVQDVVLSVVESLMMVNFIMKMIYVIGELVFIGVVLVVESQGCKGDVKVFGWDLIVQVIKGIDEGWVIGVVQQDLVGEGKVVVEVFMKFKKGEKIDLVINVLVMFVIKENVDKFKVMFK